MIEGNLRRANVSELIDKRIIYVVFQVMRIGILGGTGPAGSALGLRLASVGYEVVLGSRDAQRASGVCADLASKWPDFK